MALSLGIGATVATNLDAQNTWDGFYLGGGFGYGTLNPEVHRAGSGSGGKSFRKKLPGHQSGGVLGGHLGYNWEFEEYQVVVGVEGSFNWCVHSWMVLEGSKPSKNFKAETDFLASIRARIGYDVDGHSLFYVHGGPAWIQSEQNRNHTSSAKRALVDFEKIGGVVGIGLDHKIADNISIRGEASWYFFSEKDVHHPSGSSGSGVSTLDMDPFVFEIGANYHF